MDERAGALTTAGDDDADVLDATTDETESLEIAATRDQIEQTRAKMAETIDALKEKLSPEHLVEQAKETVREATIGRAQDAVSGAIDRAREAASSAVETAREVTRNTLQTTQEAVSHAGEMARGTGVMIMDTIRENPIPAALIGIGIGWLLLNNRREGRRPQEYSDGYARRYTPQYDEGPGVVDRARDAVGPGHRDGPRGG
ncbi:MAG: hypothetical protein C4321_10010, partial [Chloroflexota bacterium]